MNSGERKAEAKQYFEENLSLEVKILNKKKKKNIDLVELNLKENKDGKKSISLLNKKNTNEQLKKLTKEELLLVYLGLSEVYINEKNYKQAVNYLEKAQKTNQLKELEPRVFFILAQLYERLQNGDKALENYNNVIKSNPDYEMSFRASLNKANSYAYSSGDPQNLLKDYNKMLKDIKNIEYRKYYRIFKNSFKKFVFWYFFPDY